MAHKKVVKKIQNWNTKRVNTKKVEAMFGKSVHHPRNKSVKQR